MENKLENNPAISFLNEMVDSYNTGVLKDEEIIFEIYFKDLDETYQLHLFPDKCILKKEDFLNYTTRLEANFEKFSGVIKGRKDCEKIVFSKKDFDISGNPRTIVLLISLFSLFTEADPANVFKMLLICSYKVNVLKDEEIFIELHFKDIERTCYIIFSEKDCLVNTSPFFEKYDTRIETTLEDWVELIQGGNHMDFIYSGKMEIKGDITNLLKITEVYDIVSFQY